MKIKASDCEVVYHHNPGHITRYDFISQLAAAYERMYAELEAARAEAAHNYALYVAAMGGLLPDTTLTIGGNP